MRVDTIKKAVIIAGLVLVIGCEHISHGAPPRRCRFPGDVSRQYVRLTYRSSPRGRFWYSGRNESARRVYIHTVKYLT